VLPDACSGAVYQSANEPKELVLCPGAGHGLDEVREELLDRLVRWIPVHLDPDPAETPPHDRPE
jgi:hypothetical protein